MINSNEYTLITGVGKGFGRHLFIHRVLNFGKVIGFTRSEQDVESLHRELENYSGQYKLFIVDLTDTEHVTSMLKKLSYEGIFIKNIINNAGIRFRKTYLDISVKDLKHVLDNNLVSVHNICRNCIPHMISNGGGRIINISSILGEAALPDLAGYSVTKGALDALTRSLAIEFADKNITVNGIAPGFCKTSYYSAFKKNKRLHSDILDRIPMKRWGESSEIVGLCDFLLSDSASYITGTTIPIDGGWLAC